MSIPPNDPKNTRGAPPDHIHLGPPKTTNWLAWVLLGLGIFAALLALSRCHRADTVTTTTAATTTAATTAAATNLATGSAVVAATETASVGELGPYLAGSEAAPRTFAFDNLNFDTGKSDIRPEDRPTVDKVAMVLGQYPKARIRIAGYADARGTDAANRKLGEDRAEALKAALVAKGVDPGRVATISGGKDDPIATNSTAQGKAENRRTELVVLSR